MKSYIICCVPAQIPYLEKLLFLGYGPKCFQSVRLQDFFNQRYFNDYWVGMVRNGHDRLVHETLKST